MNTRMGLQIRLEHNDRMTRFLAAHRRITHLTSKLEFADSNTKKFHLVKAFVAHVAL